MMIVKENLVQPKNIFILSVRIYEEYQELEEDSTKKQFYDDFDKILFSKNVQSLPH